MLGASGGTSPSARGTSGTPLTFSPVAAPDMTVWDVERAWSDGWSAVRVPAAAAQQAGAVRTPIPLGVRRTVASGQVHALGMHTMRVEHPLRAPVAVRVQDEPCCAHQDKLLLQRQRRQHLLGAYTGTGGPLALCAGTGGQLVHTTGTRGVGMGG